MNGTSDVPPPPTNTGQQVAPVTDQQVEIDMACEVLQLYGVSRRLTESLGNAVGRLAERLKKERVPYQDLAHQLTVTRMLLSELSHSWVNGRRVIDGCGKDVADRIRMIIQIADAQP